MAGETLRVLLTGATGVVGQHVLRLALADARFGSVVAPTRRPLAAHPKLTNPVVDFAALPADADWWSVDGVISALGTTQRIAGSPEAFRAVDHGYTLAVARLAHDRGATRFALTSSLGADPAARSSFYLRTKGEIERDVGEIGFASLTIVRPGLLGGTGRAPAGRGRGQGRPRPHRPDPARALAHQPAGTRGRSTRGGDRRRPVRPPRHQLRSPGLTSLFHALADPTRRAMLRRLAMQLPLRQEAARAVLARRDELALGGACVSIWCGASRSAIESDGRAIHQGHRKAR